MAQERETGSERAVESERECNNGMGLRRANGISVIQWTDKGKYTAF